MKRAWDALTPREQANREATRRPDVSGAGLLILESALSQAPDEIEAGCCLYRMDFGRDE